MTINKILYTHTYQIGLSQWQKIGLEAELNEGEDCQAALALLKVECDQFHLTSTSQINGNGATVEKDGGMNVTDIPPKPLVINREYERKQIEIENVSSLEELSKHKDYCSKHPDLMPVYMSKMKQLK